MNPIDRSSRRSWLGRSLLLASLALAACNLGPGAPQQPPQQGFATQSQDLWTNGLFTANAPGTTPPSGWTVTTYDNPGVSGTATAPPTTFTGLNLTATANSAGIEETYSVGGTNGAGQYADPDLGTGQTFRYPLFGDGAARVNYQGPASGSSQIVGAGKNLNVLSQTMTVSDSDIDPNDGLVHVRFGIAPVLENPSHPYAEQPYYFIQLLDLTTGQQLYNVFNYAGQVGIPWITAVGVLRGNETQWLNWGLVDISSATSPISVGDEVELQIVASGCSLGGHFGRVYVDAIGPTIPGLFVEASASPSVAAGGTLVYTLTYTNGGTSSSVGSYVDFTTPPGTTFASTSNASCTGGTAGSASTLTCPIGTVAAGARGSFTVTVNVTATSGTVVNGNYLCGAVNEPQLLGPAITTNVVGASTPLADVQLTNTASASAINWSPSSGGATAGPGYTIVVTNAGPTALTTGTTCTYSGGNCNYKNEGTGTGCTNTTCKQANHGTCTLTKNCTAGNLVTVSDTFPSELTSVKWSCAHSGTTGSKCSSSSSTLSNQTGNVSLNPVLPSGGIITITVTDNMIQQPGAPVPTSFTNTASVTAGAGVTDPNLNNNTQSAITLIGTPETLTLTHTGKTYGTVLSTPSGIDCGTSCSSASASFSYGSTVALYAQPVAGGDTFNGWSLTGGGTVPCANGATSSPCTFTITAATGITATFAAAPAAGSVADVYAYSGSGQLASTSTAFTSSLVAFVTDGNGTPLSNQSVTFTAPGSGASGTFSNSTDTISVNTNASGLASATFTANSNSGTYSVTVASGGINAPTGFTLTNVGPPAQLIYLSGGNNSTPSTSGGGEQMATVNSQFGSPLAVIVEDASNNPVPGATVDFSVTTVSGATATLSSSSATTNASGQASVTATANGTASGTPSYTASATVSGYAGAGTVTFYLANITGTAAAVYVVSGSGQDTPVTAAYNLPLVAVVADAAGNPVSGASVTFTAVAGANGQSATIVGSPATTNALGEASVTATANSSPGTFTVTASVTGATSANFTLINDGDQTVSVNAGSPQSATVGTAFGTALSALVVDSTDTPVSGVDVTFTVNPGTGGATASICSASSTCGTSVVVTTDSNGLATLYSETAGTVAGNYTVQASTVESSEVYFDLTNVAGTASAIALKSGSGQSTPVGSSFGAPLVVLVTDVDGNPVSGTSVTFAAVPSNGASATVTGSPATSDVTGQASVTVQAGTGAGSYTVTATSGSLSGSPVTFNLTNNAGTPTSIAIVSGTPQSATVGAQFGSPLVAVVEDADGNFVPNVTVTYTAVPVGGATASLPNSGQATTNGLGQASLTPTAGTEAGAYTVTASASGTNTITYNLTNNAGSPHSIAIVSGTPQSVTVGDAFASLVTVVKDIDNNLLSGVTVTYTANPVGGATATLGNSGSATTNGSGQATLTATAGTVSGAYTVTASASGTNTVTFNLTNAVGAPASIAVVSGTPQTVGVGSSFANLITVVEDSDGNPVSNVIVTYAAPGNGASAMLGNGGSATTNSQGQASVTAGAITSAGTYDVTAATNGVTGKAYFSLTNTCVLSSQCPSGDYCNSSVCTPLLPNGSTPPGGGCGGTFGASACASGACDTNNNECGYANADGPCVASSSSAVCQSGVCDSDSLCGYKNGDGSCSSSDATSVCRSAVCGVDGQCGYPNGDGPCTSVTAATVCRTAVCDTDDLCGYANAPYPAGGGGSCTSNTVCRSGFCDTTAALDECGYAVGDGPCTPSNQALSCQSGACNGLTYFCEVPPNCPNGDSDCTIASLLAGTYGPSTVVPYNYWCNIAAGNYCTPPVVNGGPMPTDGQHTTVTGQPTVNGLCNAAAAAVVCVSGVCDSDNRCGYANGDGTCTGFANNVAVCRSGTCSAEGICMPPSTCDVDADCSAGSWCNVPQCVPQLTNGVSLPTVTLRDTAIDGTLDGTCASASATGNSSGNTPVADVCASAVCDTNDNECGLANGDGVCTALNGATICRSGVCDTTPSPGFGDNNCGYVNGDGPCNSGNETTVCRSAVCDPDSNCGYANGDGPCIPLGDPGANGSTVCRSGLCGAGGTCIPNGGCSTDADCTGSNAGKWCDESTSTCTAKIANGGPIPTDPPHTNPTLNDTCTSGAATLTCVSLVCDTNDNECGYANGDGPCTSGTAATVCRSGVCSQNGDCMASGGCNVDADCTGGDWCEESTHTCTVQISNGVLIPTDPPHTNPTLNATCTTGAATLVCVSGVCDTNDNECGYADGDGPCTSLDGATVCRSGVCSQNGTCMAPGTCNVDADCTASGDWCNETAHSCGPQLPNGTPIPTDPPHTSPQLNGNCTGGAATLVCSSGACDTNDNECGYANGDGPCTSGTVCRSGTCSASDVCMAPGSCDVDADCSAGNWCFISTHACTAKYVSGTPLPIDPSGPHASLLTGQCSVTGAATLVCASGVCDSLNNECGYANSDGTCTPGPSVAICQTGVCDPDGKCGYAPGDGPCVTGASALCRSGVCSVDDLCETLGGCNVDADCTGGNWCDISLHACEAKLPDGTSLPTDPGHVSPTLNGDCNAGAATLVCASGVCDTDNRCGYANSDGPCTPLVSGSAVCRSGACSVNDTCMPAGGCNVNGDCISGDYCQLPNHICLVIPAPGGCSSDVQCPGKWCDIAVTTCETLLPNGSPIPNDPTHTSPTLNGSCTSSAATLVCVSSVCDTADNECGYANGDGSCTQGNATTVCRSGICNNSGVCGPNVSSSSSVGTSSSSTSSSNSEASSSVSGSNSSASSTMSSSSSVASSTSSSGNSTSVSSSSSSSGAASSSGGGNSTSVGTSSSSGSGGTSSSGCKLDSQCGAGLWCDIASATCTPQIPDGSPMPTDPGHSTPTLNGVCNAAAATLVCASGVCDADNKCGYENADGPCTQANGASVCRSGVCDTDGKCGFANADGPCTQANGATVCRSGVCDPDGSCGYVNADGPCTQANGTTVCRSAVCDPDGDCGYATGDGPCSSTDAATVCRSGLCSASDVCLAPASCDVDADCTGGFWCDISVHTCTAPLPDGTSMPTDPPHQNPVLDGICTPAAATLVCAAGVCDTADNKCGFAAGDGNCNASDAAKVCRAGVCDPTDGQCAFANGDGSCNASNGSTVCRSGVCDTDGQCGYANGNGPCSSQNGSTVCRSGTCSSTGVCEGAGSCDADADCTGGLWCDVSIHTCDPKLPNGVVIPTDPGHTNPVLDGVCTAPAATLVCVSSVCDTADDKCGFANSDGSCSQTDETVVCRSLVCDPDGKCGYADGDGTCTSLTASTVCRSSVCSTAGICMGAGQCEAQTDCPANTWCDNATNTCAGKLANGAQIPKETGPQANPVLDGVCTPPAAQLVCGADVCDTNDNRCAFANSDGTCTAVNASTVCRSGACDPDGACGYANGDGTCSSANASIVCRSQACDGRDQKCGYAIEDGPCSTTAQCRSGGCVNGTCIYSINQVTPGGGWSCGSTGGSADKSAGLLLVVAALFLLGRRRRS